VCPRPAAYSSLRLAVELDIAERNAFIRRCAEIVDTVRPFWITGAYVRASVEDIVAHAGGRRPPPSAGSMCGTCPSRTC
jgi:hypothetical protein